MTTITLTPNDLMKICKTFDIKSEDIFKTLSQKPKVSGRTIKRSITEVDDSDDENVSSQQCESLKMNPPMESERFATSKTYNFALEMAQLHNFKLTDIVASGKGGKVTKRDVKKLIPRKQSHVQRMRNLASLLKDPNKPKQALNAYMIFTNATREKRRLENPTLKATELVSHGAASWRALEPKEKEKWVQLAAEDKKRYNAEMAVYKGS